MARQISPIRLEEIREAIELYPEHRPGWCAEHLGLDCKTVN